LAGRAEGGEDLVAVGGTKADLGEVDADAGQDVVGAANGDGQADDVLRRSGDGQLGFADLGQRPGEALVAVDAGPYVGGGRAGRGEEGVEAIRRQKGDEQAPEAAPSPCHPTPLTEIRADSTQVVTSCWVHYARNPVSPEVCAN